MADIPIKNMLWRVLLACLYFPALSFAEEQKTYSAAEISGLLKRLEQAESKIDEFEAKLSKLETSQQQTIEPKTVEPKVEEDFQPVSSATVIESNGGESFDEFLMKTEERWSRQDKTNSDLQKAVKAAVYPGSSAATMKIAGRIHFDHWGFPGATPGINAFESGDADHGPDDRIGFRRIRFGVKGDLKDNMLYKIEMEFAGGEESQFRDVYLGFKDLPWFQTLLFGNQKRPYGLDHLNSSRFNVFLERPFVIEANNQDARRLGIASYGHSDDLEYNWRFGFYNLRLIQDEGNYISDHYQSEFAGRLAHTYWWDECTNGRGYAHFGIAGTVAHPDGNSADDEFGDVNEARFVTRAESRSLGKWIDTDEIAGTDWYELIALESVINVGPTQLVGEYQHTFLQRDDTGVDLQFKGGYAYLSYFLTGEHVPWDRKSGTLGRIKPFENFFLVDRCCGGTARGWGAWQVAVRYSYADYSDDDIFGGVAQSVTFGLNWHWNPNAQMQFNYIHGKITDRNVTDIHEVLYTSGDYDIVGTRFMVDF